jgi:L-lactate dehydrogenase complex protein LldG
MTTATLNATPSPIVEEFTKRFEQLSGRAHFCSSKAEALSTIEKIIAERARGLAYFTKLVSQMMTPSSVHSASLYDLPSTVNGLDIIKQVDVAITTASYGVAETGCFVEIAYEDSTKLLSSLSRVHIVILEAKNILKTLQELAPIIRTELSGKDKPTITLISGPSRTADIEMKMVLGVHGPHEVHGILIDE